MWGQKENKQTERNTGQGEENTKEKLRFYSSNQFI